MLHFLLWKDFFFIHTNYSHIINIWYVGFIKCYETFSNRVPIKNVLNQQPFPNGHHCWHNRKTIQDEKPNMVFPKSIIKNCFMWVTCNHLTFCNEHPTIVYKITFNSSPLKSMSSHYIWICSSHTMAIHYVIIPTCIPLFIILLISFKIFPPPTSSSPSTILSSFISSLMESNLNSHTMLKVITHFTM